MRIMLQYPTTISFWNGLEKEVEETYPKGTVFEVKYMGISSGFVQCKFPQFKNVDGRFFILHPDAYQILSCDKHYIEEMA